MNLHAILSIDSTFLLFLAPPGWGKTTLILNIYDSYPGHLIFVSPLRALANEFYKRASQFKYVYLVRKRDDLKNIQEKFFEKDSGLLVLTPETLNESFLDLSSNQKVKPIFILDEFHLFYYWGESFRFKLWDACQAISNSGSSILGLTATIEKDMIERWKKDFLLGMNQLYLLDLGNRKLKFNPVAHLDYSFIGKKLFNTHFINLLDANVDKTYLYFCKYRTEVDFWISFCKRRKIEVLGCKGGEVESFLMALEEIPKPKCIFSTTALSHGVNLPEVSKVFISFRVEYRDFLLQMIGRGGRSGSPYQAYTFGDNETSYKERIIGGLKVLKKSFSMLFDLW